MDYKVIVVWECELKECFEYRMEKLVEEITELMI
jgi:DNA mismatch endonuclease (patch repair protein)